mgnify:CR=1 FL=1
MQSVVNQMFLKLCLNKTPKSICIDPSTHSVMTKSHTLYHLSFFHQHYVHYRQLHGEWPNSHIFFWIKDAISHAGLAPTLATAQNYFQTLRKKIEEK